MRISVVIPAYNEAQYISNCLASVVQHAPHDLLEILVIDNASTDNTAAIAKQYALVRVVHESHKGLTHARQRGLMEAKGDVLFCIDADSIVPEHWFERMQRELEKTNVVCVSGPYRFYDLPARYRIFVEIYWRICAQCIYLFARYMLVGGNFAVRKDALVAAGGFDTSIQFYGEDTDIGRRLAKIGKVAFRQNVYIGSSARRLRAEGLIRTPVVYVLNYFWIVVFHKPLTSDYKDIR